DADYHITLAVQLYLAANHPRVTAESALPKTVAQDRDAIATGLFFLGQKTPSERRRYPQRRKQVRGHAQRRHSLRLVDACQIERGEFICRQLLIDLLLLPPIHEIGS